MTYGVELNSPINAKRCDLGGEEIVSSSSITKSKVFNQRIESIIFTEIFFRKVIGWC